MQPKPCGLTGCSSPATSSEQLLPLNHRFHLLAAYLETPIRLRAAQPGGIFRRCLSGADLSNPQGLQCCSVSSVSSAFVLCACWNAAHCIQDIIKEEFCNWPNAYFSASQFVSHVIAVTHWICWFVSRELNTNGWSSYYLQCVCNPLQDSAAFTAGVGNLCVEQLMCCHNFQFAAAELGLTQMFITLSKAWQFRNSFVHGSATAASGHSF